MSRIGDIESKDILLTTYTINIAKQAFSLAKCW